MSERVDAEQEVKAYKDAEDLFNKWRKQRNETIQKIRDIANEIQQLETTRRKGQVASSSVGMVAGALTIAGICGAPFTLGGTLGLTAAGAATGFISGAASITHNWLNSNRIKSKCNEAAELLRDGQALTKRLFEKLEHFHVLQSNLCDAVGVRTLSQMTLSTLGSIAGIGGDFLAVLATNIPRMARSTRGLANMFGFRGITLGATFTLPNFGTALAPEIGRQTAAGVARSSLRVIGTTAVGVGVLMDVLTIVNNAQALDSNKLCDRAHALKDTADTMEKEMFRLDSVFCLDLDKSMDLDKTP